MKLLLTTALLLSACTLNRPSTGAGRTAPMMMTMSAAPRDTLFARAFAAMRGRGYTEITPDAPASQVRGKSPQGTSVIVAFASGTADSTRVTISASSERPSAKMDTDALATVLTLMADITRPPGVSGDSTARKP